MKDARAIFGFHAVLARLRADPASVIEVFVDEARHDARMRDVVSAAERAGVPLHRVAAKRLDGFYGGGRHQGVVARVSGADARASLDDLLDGLAELPLLLILDGVTDPHNLGACLRVADAAGVHAVIAPKDRSAGLSATVMKVASGAAESVPFFPVTNLARTLGELKERGIWIVGTDGAAPADLYSADLPEPVAWVMGSEGEGMRRLTRETCDLLVRIPMHGRVESLNVSVAAGLCVYESRRRRGLAGPGGGLRRGAESR
ncbi:MAG: 23S rRNA (guanosine(2251)-2'-O)-methyltransferase RlmB [Burkholderiales bacterium]|nr:23S rRNA (guanosine(2251)-2'-O)-methyltransferase RlmB [Burkholderiales bacterium]